MKSFFLSVLAIFFFSSYTESAFSQQIPISYLKENRKIDELMNRVFKEGPDPRQVDKSTLSDSCWYLQVFKWDQDNSISFQIKPISKNLMNFTVNDLDDKKQDYGYFIYKGRFVLVWSNKELPGLFAATGSRRLFKFLFHTTFDQDTEKSMRYSMHYKMVGGIISAEGGPPPMATH